MARTVSSMWAGRMGARVSSGIAAPYPDGEGQTHCEASSEVGILPSGVSWCTACGST